MPSTEAERRPTNGSGRPHDPKVCGLNSDDEPSYCPGCIDRTPKGVPTETEQRYHAGEKNGKPAKRTATPRQTKADRPPEKGFQNFEEFTTITDGKPDTVRIGIPLPRLYTNLSTLTGGWPKRVGPRIFAEGERSAPMWIESADGLLAWVARFVPQEGGNRVRFVVGGGDKPTAGQLLSYCQQSAESYDAVEAFPHEPKLPRHYYMHPPLAGGDGKALARLLARFSPATEADAQLVKAFLLTLVWGGPPGHRPAFLFTGLDDDAAGGRGIGKTTIPRLASELVGGLIAASTRDDFGAIKVRLLSPDGLGKRILLFDNLKTLRLSSDDLEQLITSKVVSGHAMYVGNAERPNAMVIVLTINGASLSKDMAQRCVPIMLARPNYSPDWETETQDLIEREHWAILGDLAAELRKPRQRIASSTRWGVWERDILGRLNDPTGLQRVIAERQEGIDTDADEAGEVRDAIAAELKRQGYDPDEGPWFIATKDLVPILSEVLNERLATNKVSAKLKTFAIAELRQGKHRTYGRGEVRGWRWTGKNAGLNETREATFGTIPP